MVGTRVTDMEGGWRRKNRGRYSVYKPPVLGMIDQAIYSPSPCSMRYSPRSSLLKSSHHRSRRHLSPCIPRILLCLQSRIRSTTLIRHRPYRYHAILRYRRHRAHVCAGLYHSRVVLSNRPHAYHLPLHNGLHVHLYQFDPASSMIGLHWGQRAIYPVGTL